METIHLFMPLLVELGGFGDGLCYKQVAPDGALAFHRHLFNKATRSVFRRRVAPGNPQTDAVF